jgi:hypothetical protein
LGYHSKLRNVSGQSCEKDIFVFAYSFELLTKSRRRRVYHPCEALYIIKPQENTRWRMMRYNNGSAVVGDIHRTPRGDDMPSLWLG